MLVHLYAVHAWAENRKVDPETPRANGTPSRRSNGHANEYTRTDRRIQEAEEFELGGLDSDEDDDSLANKETRPLVASRQ